jgi:hypothetical protein
MTHDARIAVLFLAAACAQRQVPETRPLGAVGGSEVEINRVIDQALQADGRSQPADSLYAPHAVVIADGKTRRAAPRFAGVGPDGEIAITNTQLEIRGAAAWGDVEYRWVSDRTNQVRVGRASFVLTPAPGRTGWWVVHAHSSVGR